MSESAPSLVEQSVVEQKPYENPAVQNLMGDLFAIHDDSVKPKFVDRKTWEEKRETGLIEQGQDEKKIVYVSPDLQLWELPDVIENLDKDALGNNSEKGGAYGEKMRDLGQKFRNSGIYIAQRLEHIHTGRPIAENLAEQFYNYGESLVTGWKSDEQADIAKISQLDLTTDETLAVDQWLAGDEIYRKHKASVATRAQKTEKPEEVLLEEQRQRDLKHYFYIVEKGVSDEKLDINSPNYRTLAKSRHNARRAIETSKRELTTSIARRGMKLLNRTMGFDKLTASMEAFESGQIDLSNIDPWERPAEMKRLAGLKDVITTFEKWENAETTLREGLGIDALKSELETVRQSGDMAAIVKKEEDIIKRIQYAVSAFPYKERTSSPSEIVKEQERNCIGASLLSGTFLSDVGIKYLVGDLPTHSVLFTITSDGAVAQRDMLRAESNKPITQDTLNGTKSNGKPVMVEDIVKLSNDPSGEALLLQEGPNFIAVYHPETGHQEQILLNTCLDFVHQGKFQEAIAASKQVVEFNPRSISGHNLLAMCYLETGNDTEALKEAEKSYNINDRYPNTALIYANALAKKDTSRAIGAYQYVIDLLEEEGLDVVAPFHEYKITAEQYISEHSSRQAA
jgi:tetratricopeptide (TPR) repeat protein